jgi:transposase
VDQKIGIGNCCRANKFASNITDKKPMPMQSNKLDFSGQNIYVGFDVHLKSWSVSIMVEDILHRTFSQDPSPQILYNYLTTNFPNGNYHSAYEAGFCGFWIHRDLEKLGVKSIIVNPADIPTTNKESSQKNDNRDSKKIVRSLRAGLLQPIHVPSQQILEARSLLRVRTSITKDLTRAKLRLKNHLYFYGIGIPKDLQKQSVSWTKTYLEWVGNIQGSTCFKESIQALLKHGIQLKESKKEITQRIRTMSKELMYEQDYWLLRSVPGIGDVNALTFLFEIGDFQRFPHVDQFCSFLGLVPSTRSSGEKERSGDITHRGHTILRNTLVESSWVAIRRDPALMQKFLRLEKKMDSNKAIIRIAKSIAGRILFVMRNKKPYELRKRI